MHKHNPRNRNSFFISLLARWRNSPDLQGIYHKILLQGALTHTKTTNVFLLQLVLSDFLELAGWFKLAAHKTQHDIHSWRGQDKRQWSRRLLDTSQVFFTSKIITKYRKQLGYNYNVQNSIVPHAQQKNEGLDSSLPSDLTKMCWPPILSQKIVFFPD